MAYSTTLPLIERVIAAVSPKWALARHRDRVAMAATGGYVGAGYRESLSMWRPGSSDADAALLYDLPELRARSHDLVRNSPIAGGAIESEVSHVVGTGLSLQSRIDARRLGMTDEQATEWQAAAESEFAMWAESTLADARGDMDFYELQDLAYRSARESGDSGVVLAGMDRQDWPYRLALQVIEADLISNPYGAPDTPTLVHGIERSASGETVAAHIASRHPGSRQFTGMTTWTRLPFRGASGRRNFLLLRRVLRPGQTRGVPALAPIIEPLKQLTRYSTAEVDAAVNSAVNAVFTSMDPEAFADLFDEDGKTAIIDRAMQWDGGVNSGRAINLLPGEAVSAPTPGRPNPNFDPFVGAVMKQIGIGLGIPHEVLMKAFQSSYSAARAALLDAWRTFRIRRQWLASKFCQPVYEEFLSEAVASGRISAPGFFADPAIRRAWCGASWCGDGPGSIDPSKEAEAAGKRLEIGLTTLPDEMMAYDGGDWETRHRVQVRVAKARKEAGLGAAAPAANPPPEQQQQRQQEPPPQRPDDISDDDAT